MRSLEVFLAVAATGQMRAGAKLLNLSQPAASQHIAALEEAFGTRLLDRGTRPARLTHAGARLLLKAQKILDAVSEMETELRHVGQKSLSLLRVGLQASIATTLTPPLIALAQGAFGVKDMTLYAGQSGQSRTALAYQTGRSRDHLQPVSRYGWARTASCAERTVSVGAA